MTVPPDTVVHTLVPANPSPPKPKGPKPPDVTGFGMLHFLGVGKYQRSPNSFSVMAGDNPPTVVGGYAKWTTISRPLLRGVTVFQGYDPAQLKIEVRFGRWDARGWHVDPKSAQAVEEDINTLEWMAGAQFTGGPSPIVYASSYDSQGNTTALIPPEYQSTIGISSYWLKDDRKWPWVINGGIEWGTAIRNRWGWRVRQDASFTLTNYLPIQGSLPKQTTPGGWFTAKPGRDTPLLIAEAPTANTTALDARTLADQIMSNGKNKHLRLRSRYQQIKDGTRVWVPGHST